jgi:hypothetical protein
MIESQNIDDLEQTGIDRGCILMANQAAVQCGPSKA